MDQAQIQKREEINYVSKWKGGCVCKNLQPSLSQSTLQLHIIYPPQFSNTFNPSQDPQKSHPITTLAWSSGPNLDQCRCRWGSSDPDSCLQLLGCDWSNLRTRELKGSHYLPNTYPIHNGETRIENCNGRIQKGRKQAAHNSHWSTATLKSSGGTSPGPWLVPGWFSMSLSSTLWLLDCLLWVMLHFP